MSKTKNIVLIGDSGVGKTCLINMFINKHYNEETLSTIYNKIGYQNIVDDKKYFFKLHDLPGKDEYENIRKLIYLATDCYIVCYDVEDRFSYANVIKKWMPKIFAWNNAPIILVGTKKDTFDEDNRIKFSSNSIKLLAKNIKAYSYYECSSKHNTNIQGIFNDAETAAINKI